METYFSKYIPKNKETKYLYIEHGQMEYFVPIENVELGGSFIRIFGEFLKKNYFWSKDQFNFTAFGEKYTDRVFILNSCNKDMTETCELPYWAEISIEEAMNKMNKEEKLQFSFFQKM